MKTYKPLEPYRVAKEFKEKMPSKGQLYKQYCIALFSSIILSVDSFFALVNMHINMRFAIALIIYIVVLMGMLFRFRKQNPEVDSAIDHKRIMESILKKYHADYNSYSLLMVQHLIKKYKEAMSEQPSFNLQKLWSVVAAASSISFLRYALEHNNPIEVTFIVALAVSVYCLIQMARVLCALYFDPPYKILIEALEYIELDFLAEEDRIR